MIVFRWGVYFIWEENFWENLTSVRYFVICIILFLIEIRFFLHLNIPTTVSLPCTPPGCSHFSLSLIHSPFPCSVFLQNSGVFQETSTKIKKEGNNIASESPHINFGQATQLEEKSTKCRQKSQRHPPLPLLGVPREHPATQPWDLWEDLAQTRKVHICRFYLCGPVNPA